MKRNTNLPVSAQDKTADIRQLPTVKYGSPDRTLNLMGLDIQCYVLEDGTRVVAENSARSVLGLSSGGNTTIRTLCDSLNLEESDLGSNSTRTSIRTSEDIYAPIRCKRPDGGILNAVRADNIPVIALQIVLLKATGQLKKRHDHLFLPASQFVQATSRVGFAALIDEVTGYDKVKDAEAYQLLLAMYLNDYPLPWVKTFNDPFFIQLCRLRGWDLNMNTRKMPKYFGKLVNEVIYSRLPKGVLDGIKERNTDKKKRSHQWLTADAGVMSLKQTIDEATRAMSACSTWDGFMGMWNRMKPLPSSVDNPPLTDDAQYWGQP